jgi:hypothetical protein
MNTEGFHKNPDEVKEWKEARKHYSDQNFESYKNNELEKFSEIHAKKLSNLLQREHDFQRDLIPIRVEIRDNYPSPDVCELRVQDDKGQRRFHVRLPNGCRSENLLLNGDEIEQLYQTGRTESGKLRFSRGNHTLQRQEQQPKQNEREDRQSRQRDRSDDRDR